MAGQFGGAGFAGFDGKMPAGDIVLAGRDGGGFCVAFDLPNTRLETA
jgi:hypothetical protein